MDEITEEKKAEIIDFINKHKQKVCWGDLSAMRRSDGEAILKRILKDGLDDLCDSLMDNNINLYHEGLCEIKELLSEEFPDIGKECLSELASEYGEVDMNLDGFLDMLPDIDVVANVYSNYDCCNTFDRIDEPDSYLNDVLRRVSGGVSRTDYELEFSNLTSGAGILCFGVSMGIRDYLRLEEEIKTAKHIVIQKGTAFGFHSSFHGASSMFKARTMDTMMLPIVGETQYDRIGIIADIARRYSIYEVFGEKMFERGMFSFT